jgi:glycerate dehydrogenase
LFFVYTGRRRGFVEWAPNRGGGGGGTPAPTPIALTVSRVGVAKVVLTNKAVINADILAKLPNLKYIGVLATGTNIVDLKAAKAQGVVVTNVPGYSSASVAQLVFALTLELVCKTSAHARAVADGQWVRCPDFSFTVGSITELSGKRLGIVGLGAIGKRVATIGAALGMEVVASARSGGADKGPKKGELHDMPNVTVTRLGLDELFATSDVVSLHCPLTEGPDGTRGLINAARLATMKKSAILINTGRGPLVDEAALAAALKAGTIAGAGLDVLSAEPPAADNPLLSAPNCVITPHVAWASVDARRRLVSAAADNLRAFLAGKPVNVVN